MRQCLQISQALFRVCHFIKQKDLKSRIESYGVHLLESASAHDLEAAEKALDVLEKFIFLGEEIGEIHYHHAKILYGQFANLRKVFIEEKERQRVGLAIADIFSGNFVEHFGADVIKETAKNVEADIGNAAIIRQKDDAPPQLIRQNGKENIPVPAIPGNSAIDKKSQSLQSAGSIVAEDRQELIAQKIRQLGKAAMKDLIAAFPDVSERTLRYDVQKLCDRQIIERIGNGGPASYYHVKNNFLARELKTSSIELQA
ncbi:MAG: DeoR family transcriptional regulator [Candidatus Liptonbacteria bacterium]|nr:DeoR family transcriptional regulator [Candidatus Liptonbacteria bacterium]